MLRYCEVCNKEFKARPAHIRVGWGRFCSRSCRAKIILSAKGAKRSLEYIEKMKKRVKGNNYAWKGENAGYSAKHMWMTQHYGQPRKCDFCLTEKAKTFYWANKSGEYKRIRTDWYRLCQSCHFIYDNVGKKSWEKRKGWC